MEFNECQLNPTKIHILRDPEQDHILHICIPKIKFVKVIF